MSEAFEVLLWVLKFLLIGGFTALYVIGGRGGTSLAIRRILGSLWFGGGIVGFSLWQGGYSHWLLLLPLILFIGLSCGYGTGKYPNPTIFTSIRRRAFWGCVVGLSSLPLAITYGTWQLFIIQFILAVAASVTFGVLNPFKSAVNEEGIISTLCVCLIPFMIVL